MIKREVKVSGWGALQLRLGTHGIFSLIKPDGDTIVDLDRDEMVAMRQAITELLEAQRPSNYTVIHNDVLHSLQKQGAAWTSVTSVLNEVTPNWSKQSDEEVSAELRGDIPVKSGEVLAVEAIRGLAEQASPGKSYEAGLYHHLLEVAHALGYESITQSMASGAVWQDYPNSKPEPEVLVICRSRAVPQIGFLKQDGTWYAPTGIQWEPKQWCKIPPFTSIQNIPVVTREPVYPHEMGTLVDYITDSSSRSPLRVGLRCLEEMVELCLAIGNSAQRIQSAVADAIFNQCLKLKTANQTVFPSQYQRSESYDEIVKEMADVSLMFADLQYVAAISPMRVDATARAKFMALHATPRVNFAVTGDTFYLKKAHIGNNTAATGASNE